MINNRIPIRLFMLLVILLILSLFTTKPQFCFALPPIDEAAIARINSYRNGVKTGTGFLISSGEIVTAYHNIYEANRIDVYVNNTLYQDVEVVAVRPETDIAVLRFPINGTFKYYQTSIAPPNMNAGVKAYIHGLPLGFDNQLLTARFTQTGYMQSQKWTNASGKKIFVVKNLSLVPLDVIAEPGMSGSPVMDETGIVFGVFSGSLREGGRGYTWTIPIYYANPQKMRKIQKPASRITTWPDFVFLKPGLVSLQSLNQNLEAARIADRCRAQIDDYYNSWSSQLNKANYAYMKILIAKPMFEKIVNNTTNENADTQLAKLKFHYEVLEPTLDEFNAAQSHFEKESAELLTSCYSYRESS